MANFSGLANVRDDFRCSLCRQKSAFHCEHDTPYRDRLLGTYDQEKPVTITTNSRRESHRTGAHNHNNHHSTKNNGMHNANTGKHLNPIVDTRYQQGRRPDNNTAPNTNNYTKTNGQTKKNKSCVIL